MPTQEFCVYNETRENLLTPRVTVIDTKSEPLKAVKVLIEGLGPNAQSGLWLNPLDRVPTVPRLSSYDLVYLDRQCRVVKAVALVADNEVPPFDGEAASALVLPIHTFSASHTHPGDKFLLCTAAEMERRTLPSAPARQSTAFAPASPAPLVCLEPPPPVFLPAQQLQPFEISPRLADPEATGTTKTGFLRSIVHLRIQISVSITSAALHPPAPNPPAPLASAAPAPLLQAQPSLLQRGAQTTGASLAAIPLHIDRAAQSIFKAASSCAAVCAHRVTAAIGAATAPLRAFAARSSASFAAKRASWKSRYLRWAEVFVYGAPRVSTRNALHRRAPRLEEEC